MAEQKRVIVPEIRAAIDAVQKIVSRVRYTMQTNCDCSTCRMTREVLDEINAVLNSQASNEVVKKRKWFFFHRVRKWLKEYIVFKTATHEKSDA